MRCNPDALGYLGGDRRSCSDIDQLRERNTLFSYVRA